MPDLTHKPCVDKARNRTRLLTTAAHAIREHGLDVSMRAIARDARVGIATAYRHFPSKTDLLEAVLAERVSECVLVLREALDEPDPWIALQLAVDGFAELQITNPGLLPLLLDASIDGNTFAKERREHSAALEKLFRSAADSGYIDAAATVDDVRIGMMAMTAFASMPAERSAVAIRRLRDLTLRGIAAAPYRQ